MKAAPTQRRTAISCLAAVCLLVFDSNLQAVDYLRDIKPVLTSRCYSCHGSLKQKADLRLDTARSMLEAKVVIPQKSADSELLKRITSEDEDERMPPEGHALKDDQVVAIRSWIEAGAPLPENEAAEDDPLSHWAFQPVRKPELPGNTKHTNPVDAFLAAKRTEAGLEPVGTAERSILLRRLYLDLIGLPPTREQLNDDRPWEAIVEELLGSPHHGERWGRHWMDIWRYSDWYGLGAQLRYSQKHLWHWRDWIVESLNEDKGYDRMILEMLAGDEIDPTNPDTLRATGFLARNYFLFNRTTWLDSTIEHTGKAFLGLTLNCAKCHDHKYDPIEAEDYYRFRAIFEPHQVRLDPVPGVTNLEKNGLPRVFDNHLEAETFLHLRGNPDQPDKDLTITPAVPAFLSTFAPNIEPVDLPLPAYAPGTQAFVQRDQLARAEKRVTEAQKSLTEAKKALTGALTKAVSTDTKKVDPDSPGTAFLLEDDFSQLDPGRWNLEGKGLVFQDGDLVQTAASRTPGQLVSKSPLPKDFQMTCHYTTTGGPTYRSVSFRFDRDEKGDHANFIYTSEHAPGPKVQAAYTREGKTTYAPDGRSKKKDATGKPQELRIAVRDRLANVWLNGEFVLAYSFPDRIKEGYFSLSAFDATARFHSIRIESLPKEIMLTDSSNDADSGTRSTLEENVHLAELSLEAALAHQAAVKATIAADKAAYQDPDGLPTVIEKKAIDSQIRELEARAAYELAKAGDDKKKQNAAKALRKKANEIREKVKTGLANYEPLRVSRKALETPAHNETDYPPVYPEKSTGRRTMLAQWITSSDNPLTARVAVNHVWMRHFGEPLVETVFDFGRQAKEPVHQDLLDYLAAEFKESGWSLRHLHRILVNSGTYRLSSSSRNAGRNAETDPDNRVYWKMNSRRMESQIVRDSILHLAEELDLTMGGPSLDAKNAGNRRSLYFTHSPDKLDSFLTTFDDADLLQCYRRNTSIVPQQALALSNSSLSLGNAGKIAERLGAESDRTSFIENAFFQILARRPGPEEIKACKDFLSELDQLSPQRSDAFEKRFKSQLVHALLNHNDFVTIR